MSLYTTLELSGAQCFWERIEPITKTKVCDWIGVDILNEVAEIFTRNCSSNK